MPEKAMKCKDADELMALAKAEGFDITREEAEAYMAEPADVEPDSGQLKNVAGGGCCPDCKNDECFENG
jgi:predicted ribosomally synthesized peptide with nif11-like leader